MQKNEYSKLATPIKSVGRIFKEKTSKLRSPYQRDRDRIVHSTAFRRLKHKTQVFVNTTGDHYRTRITHSIEVSQIARTLGKIFSLNEDLCETLSLAHDLGHPPFGHSGEDALDESMHNFGGFNHNDQTLRVLTKIEKRHPNFDGLNLTWESLEGIVKHNGIIKNNLPYHLSKYVKLHDLKLNLQPFLESQIASISDDVAYNNHDVEDALRANLISIDQLNELNFFNEIILKIKDHYNEISDMQLIYQVLRQSMSNMINDIYYTSKKKY